MRRLLRHVLQPLFAERAVNKLVAVLPDEARALHAAALAAQTAGLGPAQVRVLGPVLARATDEELLRCGPGAPVHVGADNAFLWVEAGWGSVGAALGVTAYVGFGDGAIAQSTPLLSAVVFVGFGAIAGMLAGALKHWRPEHGWALRGVRRELQRGRWAVLVHPATADQMHSAEDALSRAAQGPVLRTE